MKAIKCLESENRLHRDISYTNVLLRDRLDSADSSANAENRNKVIQELGLTQIDAQRVSFKCREGLLIDFDYRIELSQSGRESQTITPEGVNPANEEGSYDDDEDQREAASKQCAHSGQAAVPTCVRTVSICLDRCSSLIDLLGYPSFHRDGDTYVWCPPSCCP